MYEYLADFERWKITSEDYSNRLNKVENITTECISKCKDEY